jgi:dethiobiotin synthetase
LNAIASWVEQAVTEGDEPLAVVIETAGGVFSPLSRDATNFDLARQLDAATWVLVAPDRLGVLHDVMSTLRAMQSLGRDADWLVLSAPARADASTGTNAAELRQLGVRPAVISLQRGEVEPLNAILRRQTP